MPFRQVCQKVFVTDCTFIIRDFRCTEIQSNSLIPPILSEQKQLMCQRGNQRLVIRSRKSKKTIQWPKVKKYEQWSTKLYTVCFKPLSVPIAVHFMYFGPSLRDHLCQKTIFFIFIWWSLKVKILLNYHHPMRPPLL
jgi:hypothetical protein